MSLRDPTKPNKILRLTIAPLQYPQNVSNIQKLFGLFAPTERWIQSWINNFTFPKFSIWHKTYLYPLSWLNIFLHKQYLFALNTLNIN